MTTLISYSQEPILDELSVSVGLFAKRCDDTKLASSRSGLHSPKALSKVVTFFLGSGRDSASIIGLCGFVKNLITCKNIMSMIELAYFIYADKLER